jgi:hypothetical protein
MEALFFNVSLDCSGQLETGLILLNCPGRRWLPGGNSSRLQGWHFNPRTIFQPDPVRNPRRYRYFPECSAGYLTQFTQDFRTQLSATDYGNFLANEPLPISTATISDKATQILVDQFNYLRSNSVEPLSKFLDYITYVFPQAPVFHTLMCPQLCIHD